MRSVPGVVITCEHGGNHVPSEYRHLFEGADRVLASHRGWDPGARKIGRALARAVGAPFIDSTVTRLLVDLNRTEESAAWFSEFTRGLSGPERKAIVAKYYDPHWRAVEDAVRAAKRESSGHVVLHVASHSFTATPGRIEYRHRPDRDYEIGLLYDPGSPREKAFAADWKDAILSRDSELSVRLNRPYGGWTDGLPRSLRRKHGRSYVGVELECNQASLSVPEVERMLRAVLSASLREVAPTVTARN